MRWIIFDQRIILVLQAKNYATTLALTTSSGDA